MTRWQGRVGRLQKTESMPMLPWWSSVLRRDDEKSLLWQHALQMRLAAMCDCCWWCYRERRRTIDRWR